MSRTNSSANGKKYDDKNSFDERDRLSGRIDFKCDKFAELASASYFTKISEQKLFIRGLTWRIQLIKDEDEKLGIYMNCQKQDEDKGWSCSANVTFSLHSQKKGGWNNIVKRCDEIFHPGPSDWGFVFLELEKILDPKEGWLDTDGALHVSAEIEADEPQGVNFIRRPDVLLVDGEKVWINKFHLACKSDYFGRFFYGEDAKKNTSIELDPPATVDHFKRMLDTMCPDNRHLDDDCIEGVLKLANQFLLGEVEGKCRNYLAKNFCRRSVIFKYRLADKYGFHMLKKQILDSSRKEEFFKEVDFVDNLYEFAKLDAKAREALGPRLNQVFGKKKLA